MNQYNCILVLGLVAQFLFFTTSSQISGAFNKVSSYKTNFKKSMSLSYKNSPIAYLILSVNDEEPVLEIGPNRYFLRRMTGDKGFTQHLNLVAFMLTGISVIILYFGYVINRKIQCKSLIANNLGGHAPPV